MSVSSESPCNPPFNSVKLGLFLGQFKCNFYSVNTWFTLTKERLTLIKEWFTHTTLVMKAGLRAGLAGLNLGYPENSALKPRKPS